MTTTINTRRRAVARAARYTTFCLLAIAAVLCQSRQARAQWTTSGNATSTTNNVGVGTTTPGGKLSVVGSDSTPDDTVTLTVPQSSLFGPSIRLDATNTPGGRVWTLASTGPSNTGGAGALRFYDLGANVVRMILDGAGNVGVGTTTPNYKFEIQGAPSRNTLALTGDGDVVGYAGIKLQALTTTGIASNRSSQFNLHMRKDSWYGGDGSGPSFIVESVSKAGGYAAPFMITPTNDVILNGGRGASGLTYGNVGVGTTAPTTKLHVVGDATVVGNINVTGNINAKYQDVAEWVPTTQKLSAGAVVILDIAHDNHVVASTAAYDTRVAGVVSAQPGIALGEGGEGKALVATTGRVKVKVDATRAPIHIGDLIVTSDVAGVAMRSEPVSLGGVSIHRPGTIIGKALEAFDKGTGEILVLLSLQ
jgi:hypothetical protein